LSTALSGEPRPLAADDSLAPAVAQRVAQAVGEICGKHVEEDQQPKEGEHVPPGDTAECEREQRDDDADG